MFPSPIVDIICKYVSTDAVPSLLSRNMRKVNGSILCVNRYAPPSYVEEFLEQLLIEALSPMKEEEKPYGGRVYNYLKTNSLISLSFMERAWYVYTSAICSNPHVPEEFFEKHIEEIDWNVMGKNGGPSDDFFIRHRERYERGNENFKISDGYLSNQFASFCRIPPQLVRRYGNLISLVYYASNPWVSEEILRERITSLNVSAWYYLSGNRNAPIKFLLEHEDYLDADKFITVHRVPLSFIRKRDIRIGLGKLQSYPLLPIDDICKIEDMNQKYSKAICKNANITEEWLIGMASEGKKLWYGPLSANPAVPMEFMRRNEESIHWPGMCSNPNAPIDLILRNEKKIHWDSLCSNSQFWKRLIEWELEKALLSFRWVQGETREKEGK